MIELKIEDPPVSPCPTCLSNNAKILNYSFLGVHSLAKCYCNNCNTYYYYTLPIGHDLYFPLSFSKDLTNLLYDEERAKWIALPIINSLKTPAVKLTIEKKKILESEEVIVLNCLDSCYGHVLLKLFNVSFHLNKKESVIVIIPQNFYWLVPIGVSEIWEVNCSLKQLSQVIEGFDEFIKKEFLRFKSIKLSQVCPWVDFKNMKPEHFIKKKKFHIDNFKSKTPIITFVLREDRLWIRNILFQKVYLFSIKLRINSVKKFFVWIQGKRINRLVKKIRNVYPDIEIYATGIGKTFNLNNSINDERVDEASILIENLWCNIFQKSNLVFGIHGSHMLIPTFLSGSFVELVPKDKITHLGEDIMWDQNKRFQYFLCRFLDVSSSVKTVNTHIINIIKDFPNILRQIKQNPNESMTN